MKCFLLICFGILAFYSNAQELPSEWTFGKGCKLKFKREMVIKDHSLMNSDYAIVSFSDFSGLHSGSFNGMELLSSSGSQMDLKPMHELKKSQSLAVGYSTDEITVDLNLYALTDHGLEVARLGFKDGEFSSSRFNSLDNTVGDFSRLCLVRHADNRNFWVVLNTENKFVSFLNIAGDHLPGVPSKFSSNNLGSDGHFIKATPNGQYLACGFSNGLYLIEFDNNSGKVGSAYKIDDGNFDGVEFSDDSRYLYGIKRSLSSELIQYHIGNVEDVRAFNVSVVNQEAGAIQRGPDNKIYISDGDSSLSVIDFPSKEHAGCGFISNRFRFGSKVGSGLPLHINDNKELPVNILTNSNCSDYNLTLSSFFGGLTARWDMIDPDNNVVKSFTGNTISVTLPDKRPFKFIVYFLSSAGSPLISGSTTTQFYSCPVNCSDCIFNFFPPPGKYLFSGWIMSENFVFPDKAFVTLKFHPLDLPIIKFFPDTSFQTDGWYQVKGEFTIPPSTLALVLGFYNEGECPIYLDDFRISALDSQMKTYVYDPLNFRLMAELDDRNFATFYEYDDYGNLERMELETEKGKRTTKEQRTFLKKE